MVVGVTSKYLDQSRECNCLIANNRKLTAGYLAEELGCPFSSEESVVPKIAVSCPYVGRKHIDGFTQAMLKTTTDSILLLVLTGRNG